MKQYSFWRRAFLLLILSGGSLGAQTPGMISFGIGTSQFSFPTVSNQTYTVFQEDAGGVTQQMITGDGLPHILKDLPFAGGLTRYRVEDANGPVDGATTAIQDVLLRFNTLANTLYGIESSVDLVHWIHQTEIVGTGAPLDLLLPNTAAPYNYFRVSELDAPVPAPETGGLIGFVYSSDGGASLNLDRFGADNPAVGTTAAIKDSQITATADEDGRFRLLNVPVGEVTLVVSNAMTSVEFPATVYPNLISIVDAGNLTRAQALAIFNNRTLAAAGNLNTCLILGTQNPIAFDAVIDSVQPLGQDPSFNSITLQSFTWIFLIDPYPTSAFGHPVTWVLIDDSSEEVTLLERTFWPEINGRPLWDTFHARRNPDDVIAAPSSEPPLFNIDLGPVIPGNVDTGGSTAPNRQSVQGLATTQGATDDGKVYGMFVNAAMRTEYPFILAVDRAMTALQPDVEAFLQAGPKSGFPKFYNKIIESWYPDMKTNDTLVIYIVGHGQQAEDTKLPSADIFWYDKNKTPIGAMDIIKPLKKVPACNLIIIVDACFSGSFISGHETSIPSVKRFPTLMEIMLPKSVQALVITSTDENTTAKFADGNFWPTGVTTGSQFVNELISGGLFAKNPKIGHIKDNFSGISGKGWAKAQGAKTFFRARDPNAPCGVPVGIIEKEPNDTPQTAQMIPKPDPMDTVIINGSIDQTSADEDVFIIELDPGWFNLVSLGNDQNISVDPEMGSTIENTGAVEFKVDSTQSVTLSISGGTHDDDYLVLLEPINPRAAIRMVNNSSEWLGFRLVTNEELVNGGRFITLQPGDSFNQSFEQPLTGFNILGFHNVDGIIRGGDESFAIPISDGERLVFEFTGFGDSFNVESL